ncbi:MAG TPA: hypothetical protein EYG85_01365 [Crocinitomix sp.]|nr:hypothetical protein [Crocinitomix sp.]
MILKLYKTNYFLGLALIPLVAFVLSLPIIFSEVKLINYTYQWQIDVFGFVQQIKWLNVLLTFLFITLNAVMLNNFFNKSHFFTKITYVPAIIYLILLSFIHYLSFAPFIFEHFLLIVLVTQLIKINQNKLAIDTIFKSSLIIGLLYCFSSYYIILFPFGIITLTIIKAFNIKEWLVSFLGILIPIIWFYALQFLFDKPFEYPKFIGQYVSNTQFQIFDYIQGVGFLLLVISNIFPLFGYYSRNKVIVKKQLLTIVVLQVLTVIISIIAYNFYGVLDYSLLIPLAILISLNSNYIKSDAFLSFLLTFLLIINIVHLFWS